MRSINFPRLTLSLFLFISITSLVSANVDSTKSKRIITLASYISVSPDGETIAFAWNGDLWSASIDGGAAHQLTLHPADDKQPIFSPDGKEIAFASKRDGEWQVYTMPAKGGIPIRITFHSEGNWLMGWYSNGENLLTSAARDNDPFNSNRLFKIDREGKTPEQLLFDAYIYDGTISPDGNTVLFTREGDGKYRKDYVGTKARQIWTYDIEKETYKSFHNDNICRNHPIWKPKADGFYYFGAEKDGLNIWEYNTETGKERKLTEFKDALLLYPSLSKDGSTLVFRKDFDLYRFNPKRNRDPEKIELWHEVDNTQTRIERRTATTASSAAFTKDGLEVAFIAELDLWVMDTVLREPHRITSTPFEDREPLFAPDDKSILFISDNGHGRDIWRAKPADPERYWWQNTQFTLDQITTHGLVNGSLTFSPDGKQIAYLCRDSELWIADANGKNARTVLTSWNSMEYDWSPDGKWIVFSKENYDADRDIFIAPIDGSREPCNLSRYPLFEGRPQWSPDGKMIAFVNTKYGDATEVCYVQLQDEDNEKTKRERSLEKALETMNKARKKPTPAPTPEPKEKAEKPDEASKKDKKTESDKEENAEEKTEDKDKKTEEKESGPEDKKEEKPKDEKEKKEEFKIDFDGLRDRIKRQSINGRINEMTWSPDSKNIALNATHNGKQGTYMMNVGGENAAPSFKTDKSGTGMKWLKTDDQIVWLASGVPGRLKGTAISAYPFNVQTDVDLIERKRVGFGICWRFVRDYFYDENLNNRDWESVYDKYANQASLAPDMEAFDQVVEMMLGELNASHQGFTPKTKDWNSGQKWNIQTAHLGLRFDPTYKGEGLKVRDVLPEGPTDRDKTRIESGELLLNIDGTSITESTSIPELFNGEPSRVVHVTVADKDGKRRSLDIESISFSKARTLLKTAWVKNNEEITSKLSNDNLGYLHIAVMMDGDLAKFQQEIYEKTVGKDGLIIDVRNNPGGYIADKLIAILCQPVHAITRGAHGGPGYLLSYQVFEAMHKPIVVLCNQNSGSNAEIFTHAIQTLNRGKVVGVETQGAVIATSTFNIMDLGSMRKSFLGFFTANDGEDMELRGAKPDYTIWPKPGELPQGIDKQLEKGVEVLQDEVRKENARPKVRLIRNTDRMRE